jgi:hypothetical protein
VVSRIACSAPLERFPLVLPQHARIVKKAHMEATPPASACSVPQVLTQKVWVLHQVQRVCPALRGQRLPQLELHHLHHALLVPQATFLHLALRNANHAHWDQFHQVLALAHVLSVLPARFRQSLGPHVQIAPEARTLMQI